MSKKNNASNGSVYVDGRTGEVREHVPTMLSHGCNIWEEHRGGYYVNRGEANEVHVFECYPDGTWTRASKLGAPLGRWNFSEGHRTAELAMCGLTAAEVGE